MKGQKHAKTPNFYCVKDLTEENKIDDCFCQFRVEFCRVCTRVISDLVMHRGRGSYVVQPQRQASTFYLS